MKTNISQIARENKLLESIQARIIKFCHGCKKVENPEEDCLYSRCKMQKLVDLIENEIIGQ